MARRIAGITIEIGGDTTQLNKALKGVDSQLSQTQRNLRDVGKLLKLDPKNTELLTQKQKYLTDAIDNTKKRLADLKTASEQAAKSAKNYDAWKAKFDPIQEALKETRQKSEDLKKQLEKLEQGGKIDTDEYRKLQGELKETDEQAKRLKEEGERVSEEYGKPISPEKFDALQREIVETEQDLEGLQKEFKDFGSVAKQKLIAVGDNLKDLGGKIKSVGGTLTKNVTTPIIAAFTAATKGALDFEDGIAKIYTIADKSAVPIEKMRDGIKDLSNKSGKSLGELSESVYQALSASVPEENVLAFTENAVNLAKAGFLDTASAVDVLTTTINAYGYSAEDAEKISNELVKTQNDGKTSVNELAQSLGSVIPTASALNVPLEQLTSAYVMTTKQGINTANSTTMINSMLTELSKNSSGVSKILKEKTGKTFGELEKSGYTLGDVLGLLYEHVGGNSEAFANLWGNVRAGKGALAIVNGGIENYNQEVKGMESSSGTVAKALNELKTPSADLKTALTNLVNAGVEIGERLTPYIEMAAKAIKDFAEKWDGLDDNTKNTIVTVAGVAAVLGPVLVAVGSVASGIGSIIELGGILLPVIGSVGSVLFGSIIPAVGGLLAAAAPLIPIIAAIVAVVWTVVAAIKHWGEITAAVKEAFVKNGGGLKGAVAAVLAGIAGIWKASFDELDKLTGGKLGQIVKVIDQHLGWAKALFKGWKDGVVLVGGSALEAVQENLNRIAKAFKDNGGGIKGTVAALATALKGQFTVVLSFIDKLTGGKLTDIKNKFRMAFTDVARTVVGKFIYIKDSIKEKLDAAYNTVHNIVERIKSIFNFRISLPKPDIPTPHVNWIDYGTFSLPSIEWYRKAYDNAMLFRSPTVLATGAGLKGFGDGPGGEIVMGLNKLRELVGSGGETSYTATFNIYTQPGQDNRQIARMVQDQFVRWQRQKEAAKV